MKELGRKEMILVDGGADPILITSIVVAVVTFLIGVFSGYSNPKSCNK